MPFGEHEPPVAAVTGFGGGAVFGAAGSTGGASAASSPASPDFLHPWANTSASAAVAATELSFLENWIIGIPRGSDYAQRASKRQGFARARSSPARGASAP